jgi:hypothetical protein
MKRFIIGVLIFIVFLETIIIGGDAMKSMVADGGWCWFGNPRAVYSSTYDKTYYGYVNSSGDIVVASYDHSTKAIVTTALKSALEYDDHDNPTILILSDGKIACFYSAHHADPIYYRVSSSAGDISAFDAEQSVSPSTNHTYPNPCMLSGESNRIYLFYRNVDRELAYIYSDNATSTWSAEQVLVEATNYVYFQIDSNGTDRIDIAMTHATSGGSSDKVDIRHVYFAAEVLYASDGTELASKAAAGFPIDFTDATVVYSKAVTGFSSWVWDVSCNGGSPEIAYVELQDADTQIYRYAIWNGATWTDNDIVDAGTHITDDGAGEDYYTGGICLDHSAEGTVYFSVGDCTSSKIQKGVTADSGTNWTVTDFYSDGAQNVRPVVPRNSVAGMSLLWMNGNYPYYTSFDTEIFGDNADNAIALSGSGKVFYDSFNRADGAVGNDWAGDTSRYTILDDTLKRTAYEATVFLYRNAAVQDAVGFARIKETGLYPGIVLRFVNTSNFYIARLNYSDSKLQLYKCVGGSFTSLGETAWSRDSNYHSLVFQATGVSPTILKVWLDGTLKFNTTDDAAALQVTDDYGIRSTANGTIYLGTFDEFGIMTDYQITCSDLPTGYKLRITDGNGNTAVATESSGTATVDCSGLTYWPCHKAEVLNAADAVISVYLGTDDVYGGDSYAYTAPAPPASSRRMVQLI